LLKYNPTTGEFKTLLCGLHFGNGVQLLGPDQTTLLVAETTRFRIRKVDLPKLEEETTEALKVVCM